MDDETNTQKYETLLLSLGDNICLVQRDHIVIICDITLFQEKNYIHII